MSGIARILRVGVLGVGLPLVLLFCNFPQLFRFLVGGDGDGDGEDAVNDGMHNKQNAGRRSGEDVVGGLGLAMRVAIGFTLWELLTAIAVIFFTVDLSFVVDFGLSGAFIGLVTYVLPDALFEGDSSLYSWAGGLVGPLLLMLESVQIVSFVRRFSNRLYTSSYSDSNPNVVIAVSCDCSLRSACLLFVCVLTHIDKKRSQLVSRWSLTRYRLICCTRYSPTRTSPSLSQGLSRLVSSRLLSYTPPLWCWWWWWNGFSWVTMISTLALVYLLIGSHFTSLPILPDIALLSLFLAFSMRQGNTENRF